ncbi:MAG: GlmU family protein [Bacteroidales bacterium]|nr:GlmU family protein [Bacteroidales bacterium]MCF8455093.1 GlmU family protein [Bacteroidales bacterium]
MNYILFDNRYRDHLLPLTYTRPIADLRIGIITIREKWEHFLNSKCSHFTQDYLGEKFQLISKSENTLINGGLIPDANLVKSIQSLNAGQSLIADGECIAVCLTAEGLTSFNPCNARIYEEIIFESKFLQVTFPYDIFSLNGECLKQDFEWLTKGKRSEVLSSTNQVLAPENVFLEEGAKVECAILNASTGPIYIGRDAEIMEGSVIRGPFALGESSTVKLSAKIYGPTTIGPHSKVGGELNNVVIQGYSNKGHDGFLGNSVIGEWCNLGADTNNSNLKNNYAEVKVWNYVENRFKGTGLQFCGLIMGDHSKCGINTMFNTGTVVGVFANIFGSGFPRNFVPSFAWGGPQGFQEYKKVAAFYVAKLVMERRHIEFDEVEKKILEHVFEQSQKYRRFS